MHDAATINLAAEVVEVVREGRGANIGGITIRDIHTVTAERADTPEVIVSVGAVAAELLLEELEDYEDA